MSARLDARRSVALSDASPNQMRTGVCVYAAGSIAAGIFDLIWGDFEAGHQPIQALGNHIPGREILACIAGIWLVAGGVAILRHGIARAGAVALGTIYFIFGLFWLPRYYTVAHIFGFRIPVFIGVSVGVAQQLILVAAALIVCASLTTRDSAWLRKTPLIARWTFGLSSINFGLAHLTAVQVVGPMVPKWMPFGGNFWATVTGIAFLMAGLAILSGLLDVIAARLLALMLLVFSLLVLLPGPFAHPRDHVAWGSNAYNLAAIGAAWICAESIATRRDGTLTRTAGVSRGDPELRGKDRNISRRRRWIRHHTSARRNDAASFVG